MKLVLKSEKILALYINYKGCSYNNIFFAPEKGSCNFQTAV